MADEENTPETPAPVAPAAPNPEIAEMRAMVAALNDTVQAALTTSRAPVAMPNGDPANITPQLRAALRQNGLTDADINSLAPSVMPFIQALAPEFVGLVQQSVGGVSDRVAMQEMEGDGESFPHAKLLRKEIKSIIADGAKRGMAVSREAAYHTAVSTNLDKVSEAIASERSNSRGADASALNGLGHRTSSSASQRSNRPAEPSSAADLSKMTREQRRDFFEKHGDQTIQ